MKRLARLFWELFKISLLVVGGGYVILAVADEVFARLKWTEEGELLDHLPIFQMIPGIVAAHTAVYIGRKVAGPVGAAVGVTAVALPSIIIFTFVSMGYKTLPLDNAVLTSVFTGLRAAVTGILAAIIVKGWRKNLKDPFGYGVMALATGALALGGVSVVLVLAVAMLAGVVKVVCEDRAAHVAATRFNATWLPLLIFMKYGLLCFGGGFVLVPLYLEDFVGPTARYLQIPMAEFGDLMALTQMTPGPIGINGATFFGYRFAGIPGAVLASLALVVPGMILCLIALGSLERFKANVVVRGIMRGMKPASVALMLTTLFVFIGMSCVRRVEGSGFSPNFIAIALSAVALVTLMRKKMKVITLVVLSAVAAGVLRAEVVPDVETCPQLKDVRLLGYPGEKLTDLFRQRAASAFAQKNIFGEARRAFAERDDDEKGYGGVWRGEFWGKQMLSAARIADYLQDPQLTKFIICECHRMMKLQDKDGYLGSYRDKELVSITDPEKTKSIYGWYPCWNIWNRKYAMWGMLMAYKATGHKEILESVERQMTQLIDMLHRRNLKLHDTGTLQMFGLPSMSLLKPLVMLYEETHNRKYLDFAAEMLPDWDRADGECPNFFRNAKLPKKLYDWYPEPWDWAKSYEFMSCVDGLIEYYRVTGDRRCLETAAAIRDNLAANDLNPFGGVGFGDKLIGAPQYCNGLNEVCDIIHWIRLNVDLFLTTGDEKYMDSVELAYLNGYLAGIWRGGAFGPFFLRGHGRHTEQRSQCGYAYNHCCVNNLPRTFLDIASTSVTQDRAGTYHVNLFQDAVVRMNGITLTISGNYPVDRVVTVKVSDPQAQVTFRKPAWCPKMDVARKVGEAGETYTLTFDMNPRVVDRLATVPALNAKDRKIWAYRRYPDSYNPDCTASYRTTPAAQVMWGPLVLAKTRIIGDTKAEVEEPFTVNGKGYAAKVTPLKGKGMTWGLWKLELTKPGERTVDVKVSDFASGTDLPCGGPFFSIWF